MTAGWRVLGVDVAKPGSDGTFVGAWRAGRLIWAGSWRRFRDWRRGWSDADLRSGAEKVLASTGPCQVVELTDREWKALLGTPWGQSGDLGYIRGVVSRPPSGSMGDASGEMPEWTK